MCVQSHVIASDVYKDVWETEQLFKICNASNYINSLQTLVPFMQDI
jgi:hypothetical protein